MVPNPGRSTGPAPSDLCHPRQRTRTKYSPIYQRSMDLPSRQNLFLYRTRMEPVSQHLLRSMRRPLPPDLAMQVRTRITVDSSRQWHSRHMHGMRTPWAHSRRMPYHQSFHHAQMRRAWDLAWSVRYVQTPWLNAVPMPPQPSLPTPSAEADRVQHTRLKFFAPTDSRFDDRAPNSCT